MLKLFLTESELLLFNILFSFELFEAKVVLMSNGELSLWNEGIVKNSIGMRRKISAMNTALS